MKWLLLALGGISAFTGLVILLTPIPLGIPLLVVGVPLLMRYSTRAREWILRIAQCSPHLREVLAKIPTSASDPGSRD